ncbi:MAG: hypothetical protein M3068_08810 [Gemmatimonadota bacterium]|nr:hypothetical protein [Gemmatimonadota bacterium]
MTHLVEVSFKGNRREFFLWDGETPPALNSSVVVEADRGEDLGRVHALGDRAATRCLGCAHGTGTAAPSRRIIRAATGEDDRRAGELRDKDEEARRKAKERVSAHGLVMKISDAEWQWDRRKLTFYFTAERRVDFRGLVRDLAQAFRTRIELKQIGVRDEAKRLDGIGRCGRRYCSAGWLPDLRPVNLQVAKDQRLSLNPSQISGACGRLMCCLRYEHEFYVQSRKRFPKEGKILVTSVGEEKVVANDIFNDRVTLRSAEGETRIVPLADLRRELDAGHGHGDDAEDVAADPGANLVIMAMDEEGTVADDDPLDAPVGRPDGDAEESRERRPHRRRGRRSGRRNRPDAPEGRSGENAAGAAGDSEPPGGDTEA